MEVNSILQNEKVCFVCGRALTSGQDKLEDHHVFFGPNRKHSEKYGLKVWLCGDSCHRNGNLSVHKNRKIDLAVKGMAQQKFEQTHSREEFRKIFGKSWL